jgi:hypothetical protein
MEISGEYFSSRGNGLAVGDGLRYYRSMPTRVTMTLAVHTILPGPRMQRLLAIVLCSLMLAGCDKCGHWLWSKDGAQGVPLSCHAGPSPQQ